MLRPFARGAVHLLPAAPGRRYATAGLVAVVGIGLSVFIWVRDVAERRDQMTGTLRALADNTTSAIESQLNRDVDALRGLVNLTQVHDPGTGEAWRFDAGLVLEHFPGVEWIAWVPSDSSSLPFMARDTTVRLDPDLIRQARFHSTVSAIQDRWTDAYLLDVFLPTRQSGDRSGVLVGEVRVDSLWLKRHSMIGGNLSIQLIGDRGQHVMLQSTPDSLAPPWMRLQRTLTSPSGATLPMIIAPSDAVVSQVSTAWPRLFLLTGAFFSLAVGILLLQFLRLRDFAGALAATNRDLDAQLGELSRRDRELRDLNEDLERRVEARTAEVTEALREVETFSHTISHDLRSPIGAILNFTAVIEEDYGRALEGEGARLVARVRSAASRASHLLDALVEFAASSAGPEEPQVVDMDESSQRAFVEANGREGGNGDVRLVRGALPAAWADTVQVHRIFINLIGNALKFSRGRDVRVIEIGGSAERPGENTYWVRDNGGGFDPAAASELFVPFRRLHGSRVEGTGLGLAIVAKSTSRMGGRVWAESDGSTGATFYFTLPSPEGKTT
jgi:signal transduction histidine kinase